MMVDEAHAKNGIATAYQTFAQAFRDRDPVALAAHYDDDAVILAPGERAVSGKAAVRKYCEQVCALPYRFDVRGFTIEHVLLAGDYAIESSEFGGVANSLGDGTASEYRAKNLVVWRNAGGSWKIVRDMWNDLKGA